MILYTFCTLTHTHTHTHTCIHTPSPPSQVKRALPLLLSSMKAFVSLRKEKKKGDKEAQENRCALFPPPPLCLPFLSLYSSSLLPSSPSTLPLSSLPLPLLFLSPPWWLVVVVQSWGLKPGTLSLICALLLPPPPLCPPSPSSTLPLFSHGSITLCWCLLYMCSGTIL